MDRLVDDVEHLQREVQGLEARRRELLDYMETQAVRVGEEIHHEVLNTLTSYLATAIDEQDYEEAKHGLARLIAELRRIMNNLYPRDLEVEGFLQTIRNRLRDARAQLERRTRGTTVELDCPPEITDTVVIEVLNDRAHLVLLYRIVLEAISNARKHSRGTEIRVVLRAPAPGALDIAIQDNGAGHGGPFGENAGMSLMRRRAEEIGAEIEYQGAPGGGTIVLIRLAQPDPPLVREVEAGVGAAARAPEAGRKE
jgi:two-component system sensor histidine kinase UhpB